MGRTGTENGAVPGRGEKAVTRRKRGRERGRRKRSVERPRELLFEDTIDIFYYFLQFTFPAIYIILKSKKKDYHILLLFVLFCFD